MKRILTLLLAGTLTACGGGGTDTTLGSAALRGTVLTVDGSTANRVGMPVTVLETGERVATSADGSFQFNRVPTGAVTLAFGNGTRTLTMMSDDMRSEDDDGNRIIRDIRHGDDVHVEVEIENGKVVRFSRSDSERNEASNKVRSGGLEAKVEVEVEMMGEKLEAEIERFEPGTLIDFYIDDPADATSVAVLAGSAAADAEGEAQLEFETEDGDTLPLGATSVDELAGLDMIFVLASTGEELLRVRIPKASDVVLGDDNHRDDDDGDDRDDDEGDLDKGKSRLTAVEVGLEGDVEIRQEDGDQRFKMEAEMLASGRVVRFEIEDIDLADSFVTLATRAADASGEAEISTQDGLAMPFGVADVTDLVGLKVRVLDDATDEVLLTGTVPTLGTDDD